MASPELSPTIPHPSLSRPVQSMKEPPMLYHSLHQKNSSVLCLAADGEHIYSGSQGDDINVWDNTTFRLKTTLRGHTASVLALEYAQEKEWLFSASGDSTIRVWSTRNLEPLFVINPQLETDSGEILCMAWYPTFNTVYFGCQNTSLQWFSFTSLASQEVDNRPVAQYPTQYAPLEHLIENNLSSGKSTPRRVHKFFDSYPQYERRPADLNARNPTCSSCSTPPTPPRGIMTPHLMDDSCLQPHATPTPLRSMQVLPKNMIWSAHYGYVYCMALVPSQHEGTDDIPFRPGDNAQLVTGSGDSTMKVWALSTDSPVLQHTLDCGQGAVLSIVVRGDTIYAGCQDGYAQVWDMDTRTLVRSIIVEENVDILSLSMLHSDLYTCSANGLVQRWSASFNLTASWEAHSGIVLSSMITRLGESERGAYGEPGKGRFVLVTGANDDQIRIWEVSPPQPPPHADTNRGNMWLNGEEAIYRDTMIYALSKFVSIPSVSSSSSHREDCRQAAIWLRKCLHQLGADASLLATGDHTNPIVLATFMGNQTKQKKPRVLFYGHYDVVSAPKSGWQSEPFSLSARNGYLYGRGVTDNKGPIMAVACAAADLLGCRALELDLVFVIEGEEEAGSGGFEETIQANKDKIGPIDAILVSNSAWIAEDTPCITYGLRGVVHCEVQIYNKGPDLHSGVEGGAVAEPMMDMIKVLSTLVDKDNRVLLPGFYDSVRPLTEEERQLYKVLSGVTQTPASELSARWREPSLTVHDIKVSGPANATVIPSAVTARLSIRIVPDQSLDTIGKILQDCLRTEFSKLGSLNSIEVIISRNADWWLGNLDDFWFKSLEDAVREEWGVEPLRIREGGSVPSIPYLEKEFVCHALHLPLGQSTDQAHLPNERISLSNLQRGKSVVERFLIRVAKDSSP